MSVFRFALAAVLVSSLFGPHALAGTTVRLNMMPVVVSTQDLPGTPVDITTNTTGGVFVITSGNEIHSLSGVGVVLSTQSLSGAGVPVAIATSGTGDIYVAKSTGTILRLNTGLGEVASATLVGTPVDITVGPAGLVYVATTDGTIHKRAAALGPIATGSVAGTPTGIHANGSGDIFVTTTGDVHRLNAALTVLSSGSVTGTPIDVVADAAGNTIVAASGSRLHRITNTITTLSSLTLSGTLVGVSINNAGDVVSANTAGIVFVANSGLTSFDQTDVGLTLNAVATNLTGDIYAVSGASASSAPDVTVSPTAIAFTDTVVGAGASGPTASFDVAHVGGAALSVTAVSSSPATFEVMSGGAFSLASGSQAVTVRFRCPSAGAQSGTITVNATDGSATDTETVAVSGSCEVPMAQACYAPASTLAFGQVNTGTSDTENFTVSNCGTAPLVISNVSFSSTDTVWTGPTPTPPQAFPITLANDGDSKSFALRIDVPAGLTSDVPYSGTIAIVTNDDVNPPTKTLNVTATGHLPVARIAIDPAHFDIDYRDVELGFRYARPLLIRNTGDLALTFDVVRQDLADADHASFGLETGASSATFTIGPSSERIFRQTFEPAEPDGLGAKDIVIRIQNTNDNTFTFQDILLHGNGTPPIPIDSVLLLDRSGSMDETAGEGVRKIERLRNAAGLYVELLRDGTDYLGFTRYDDANDNVMGLGEISAVRATALSTLADIGSGGALEPDGGTGIGGAMRTASTQYALSPAVTPPDPAHKKVMVVLTDGNENVDPRILQVIDGTDGQPPLFDEHSDLLSYSVGLGVAGNLNEDRLQQITNRGNAGFYHVTGVLTDLNIFALENFYFKIFADAIGQMMVVDPTYEIGLNETLEVPIGIITEDREALFFFIGELPEEAYIFELVDKLGNVITSSTTVGGMSVQVKEKSNWTFFRVKFPAPDINLDYVGIWKFRVRIEEPQKWVHEPFATGAGMVGGFGQDGRHRMSFQASVGSNYRLAAAVGPGVVQVGETILLRAALTNGGWPAPNAVVRATVGRPDGGASFVDLHDDGANSDGDPGDGIFGASYTNTFPGGVYRFDFRSDGITERGENVVRMASRSQFVGTSRPDPEPEDCIPCELLKWIFVVLIVLLLGIIGLLLRRRFA